MASTATTDEAVVRVDALVCGLLDVADDITAAIVWLAEHWSADLPAPQWSTLMVDQATPIRRPVLRLRVYCSPDELDTVAALADARPVTDAEPDRLGALVAPLLGRPPRRRTCRRAFGTGRVELFAYAYERERVR